MLSLEQVKHVITFYYLEMIENYDKMTPLHIQRDCVFLNKSRGELCSDVYSNPKMKFIIQTIHHASQIQQINSVPINSMCCIDKKKIPLASGGIQLLLYDKESNITHICIQKKYQLLCYYYFKLRNYPELLQYDILKWLNKQPWYLPSACKINSILKRLLDSTFPVKIHAELNEIVDTFNKY